MKRIKYTAFIEIDSLNEEDVDLSDPSGMTEEARRIYDEEYCICGRLTDVKYELVED